VLAQAPEHLGRDAEPPGGLPDHGLEHLQPLSQPLVLGVRRRQVIERELGRPGEGAVPPWQPRLALGRDRDRRLDVLKRRVGERLQHRLLDYSRDQPAVRREQHVPDVLGPRVVRV